MRAGGCGEGEGKGGCGQGPRKRGHTSKLPNHGAECEQEGVEVMWDRGLGDEGIG